eukprot:gene60493-82768_t
MHGHLAAATSTGGVTGKRWGRIGDSPLIGAGTYADDRACAVSCTGAGEYFIRLGVAHEIAARVRLAGEGVQAALRRLGAFVVLAGVGGLLLVPWLLSLGRERTLGGALLNAWGMSVLFTAAVFYWFGLAVGAYTQAGAATGLAILLLAAPLFQPQFLVFAAVRHGVLRRQSSPEGSAASRHASLAAAGAGAAAWKPGGLSPPLSVRCLWRAGRGRDR